MNAIFGGLRHGVAAARSRTLSLIRDRSGGRVVQLTSSAFNGGNHLYLWLWAYQQRAHGRRAAVRYTRSMQPWLEEFPLLRDLTIPESEVRFLDARELRTHSRFGVDFRPDQSSEFCRELIGSSPLFQGHLEKAGSFIGPETCVINVRRGDYYSSNVFRPRFGLDIAHHVSEALDIVRGQGRSTDDLLVVSDDIPWCLRELTGHGTPVLRTVPDRGGMFDDLAALSTAQTLVLANSTFSYWGSYIARSREPQHLAIAPSHHEITSTGERVAPMFDPEWLRTSFHPLLTDGATGSAIEE